MINKIMRKLNIATIFILALVMTGVLSTSTYILASSTSNFRQTINPGTLAVDIVDASYVSVASPSVSLGATNFNFNCASTTGTFGTASQQIMISNPDAADAGWTVSLAASAPTAVWSGTGATFDYNDPTTSGCGDGADADSVAGQMSVIPSTGTIAGAPAYATTGISLGSASAFSQGTVDSITLLTGTAASADIGKWALQGVTIGQIIPAAQAAATDYNINMVVTVI